MERHPIQDAAEVMGLGVTLYGERPLAVFASVSIGGVTLINEYGEDINDGESTDVVSDGIFFEFSLVWPGEDDAQFDGARFGVKGVQIANGGYIHPHFSRGFMCQGDNGGEISERLFVAQEVNDIGAWIVFLSQLVLSARNYNPESAYNEGNFVDSGCYCTNALYKQLGIKQTRIEDAGLEDPSEYVCSGCGNSDTHDPKACVVGSHFISTMDIRRAAHISYDAVTCGGCGRAYSYPSRIHSNNGVEYCDACGYTAVSSFVVTDTGRLDVLSSQVLPFDLTRSVMGVGNVAAELTTECQYCHGHILRDYPGLGCASATSNCTREIIRNITEHGGVDD